MSIPISHIMRSKLVTCDVNSTLKQVSQTILNEDVGSVLVKQGEDIIGIITQNDLLRAVLKEKDFNQTLAKDIMSYPLDYCEYDDSLEEAFKKFEQTGRSRLVVKREGKVVGVLKRKILERFKTAQRAYKLTDISRPQTFRRGD